MDFILFVGVGAGFLAALAATAFLARGMVGSMTRPATTTLAQRRSILKGAAAGAVIAFLPTLLLATVIGATLGGTYGRALASSAGDSGALAGVALGVFAVATPLLLGAIWLGARLARWVADKG